MDLPPQANAQAPLESAANAQAPLEPTWIGYVPATTDALILVEACLRGILDPLPRRPKPYERAGLIVSGSVFVYEEAAAGIKRWTDGRHWTTSRTDGNFMVYQEAIKGPGPRSADEIIPGGLTKKTCSVPVPDAGICYHLVWYFIMAEVEARRFDIPSDNMVLGSITPRDSLGQDWRVSAAQGNNPAAQVNNPVPLVNHPAPMFIQPAPMVFYLVPMMDYPVSVVNHPAPSAMSNMSLAQRNYPNMSLQSNYPAPSMSPAQFNNPAPR